MPTSRGAGTHSASWSGFVILLALSVVAATILFAHAPARIRLIGLFAVAYGAVVGYLAAQFAKRTGLPCSSMAVALTFLAILVGQIGVAVESYRLAHRETLFTPEHAAANAMLSAAEPPENPRSRKLLEDMQATLGRGQNFSNYLGHRVAALGAWTRPWPEIFWVLEMLLASASGVCVLRVTTKVELVPAKPAATE